MGGKSGARGRREESVQVFGGNAEGKRLLGRPKYRWVYGIGMELREMNLVV
jgi:hypothetical protein